MSPEPADVPPDALHQLHEQLGIPDTRPEWMW